MSKRRSTKSDAQASRIAGDPTARRRDRDRPNHHGYAAEAKLSKRLGAKLTPGSGNNMQKGDMTVDNFRIEAKATKARTMRLELHWLEKITEQAIRTGMKPALAFQFVDESGNHVPAGSWVSIPESVFEELLEKANHAEKDDTG